MPGGKVLGQEMALRKKYRAGGGNGQSHEAYSNGRPESLAQISNEERAKRRWAIEHKYIDAYHPAAEFFAD